MPITRPPGAIQSGFFHALKGKATDAQEQRIRTDPQRQLEATRTHDGADIGGGKSHKSGYGHVGNDISSRIEAQQKRDAAGKGRC